MANLKLSKLAENLNTFSVNKLSENINERIQKGEKIYNFTQGDFAPKHFPIPAKLEEEIIKAYQEKHTSYPQASGIKELRNAISSYIKTFGNFDYAPDEIVVASGGRPLIYLLFCTIIDPGDKVIYTAPTWNNQYFIYLAGGQPIIVETKPENNFTLTPEELKPHLKEAVLVTINSPLNPGGTTISQDNLTTIFKMIVEENQERIKQNKKPLYIFFDIIYWLLTYNDIKFKNPIELNPKIRDYVVFIDGLSKCYAATGVRMGWAFGPKPIIDKMSAIVSHIGSWPPKPEQVGTARFLQNTQAVTDFINDFKIKVLTRLNIFYDACQKLKQSGYNVDAIAPQGALYLAIKLDLIGKKTPGNKTLATVSDITSYLLDNAKVALVPFYFFGTDEKFPWFRLSVGTCSVDDAKMAADQIIQLIQKL